MDDTPGERMQPSPNGANGEDGGYWTGRERRKRVQGCTPMMPEVDGSQGRPSALNLAGVCWPW